MVARHDLGEIFLGVTPKPVRDYLRSVLTGAKEQGYSRVVIPCVGRFTVAEAAIDAGWSADQIETSDISMFSSVLGYAVSGRPLAELQLKFSDELDSLQLYLDGDHAAAAVLVALKVCQLKDEKTFERIVRRDILARFAEYVEQVDEQIDTLTARLGGCRYEIADLVKVVDEASVDPRAVLYVNPPSYAKGYAKMFDTGGRIKWAEPRIAEFDAKAMRPKLYAKARESAALVFMFRGREMDAGVEDLAVFAAEGNKRTDYVLCNRPGEAKAIAKPRRETKIGSADLPYLPDDHEIRADSRIEYREVTKGQALYYRDLFAHKLGVTRAERYFVALLDGYMMAVFGMFFSEVQRGVSGKVYETFGFTVPNKRYPRLNRLFMTSIVCEDARKSFQVSCKGAIKDIDYFQTTCISTTPEQKTHRGSLKLLLRETMPDGRFKLVYGGPFKPWGFETVIQNWFDRMRNVEKETGRVMGV